MPFEQPKFEKPPEIKHEEKPEEELEEEKETEEKKREEEIEKEIEPIEIEKEKALDLNIVSLNYCETIDRMVDLVEKATLEGRVDTVMLGEYNFTVDEVLGELQKIQNLAWEKGVDVILAPDNNELGRKLTWGELKQEFQGSGVSIEQTSLADNHKPETIGMFVGKHGLTYAFPKTWHRKEVHNPVHKIPDTTIGVTICGETGHIKPEDLEGINILYNPSREGDDPYLKFRMLQRYGNQPLTKEVVSGILLEDPFYKSLLDDSQYNPSDPNYDPKYDSRDVRERRFNEAVEEHLRQAADPKSSFYVEKIEKELRLRNIPVVRCDGTRSTGILNQLPNAQFGDLEYKDAYTRYNLIMEK